MHPHTHLSLPITDNTSLNTSFQVTMSDDLSTSSVAEPGVHCWQCPFCHNVYKRRCHFDHHLKSIHQLGSEEVSSTWKISLTPDEFEEKKHQAFIIGKAIKEEEELGSGTQNRIVDSKWGPKAFSSSFFCSFCEERSQKVKIWWWTLNQIIRSSQKKKLTKHL